jgi:anaerobic selenocysteine-containing dehydrogenase
VCCGDAARGSGQWQRISWDQALTEIADALIDGMRRTVCSTVRTVN